MEFTFENHGTNTYLVYSVKPEDTVDTMSLGMLTHNKIPGLAGAQFTQMDANKFIKYNISARVSVCQFLEGVVNRKRLLGVFQGIIAGLLSAEEYMIDSKSVIMDLNYMFVDVSSYQTALICLPLMDMADNDVDLGMMFKGIIFQTQFDQSENCEYIAKLLNYLNRPSQFSLTEFRDVLKGIEQGGTTAGGVGAAPECKEPPAPAQPSAQPYGYAPAQVVEPTPIPAPAHTPQGGGAPGNKQPLLSGGGGAPATPKPTSVPSPMVPPAAVPGVPPKKKKDGKDKQQDSQPQEEKISFFYLMQHYNKENAAAYKAQKEARKANAKGKEKKEKKAKGKGQAAPAQGFSYAVPGQSGPQAAPTPMGGPTSAAVPTASQAPTAGTPGPAQPPIPGSQPVPTPQMVQQPVVTPQPTQGGAAAYTPTQPPMNMNFGETTVLMGGTAGETTVLSAAGGRAPVAAPHLIRKKNNEKIFLNKPVFRMGKERSYVDYFIGDNTAISRSHANFISRDGQYLVMDTNSTNHTFVNGVMIQSNQEVQINQGDVIRLANEDFEFHLY